MDVYTIGHSTRTLEELIKILKKFGIEALVDVRHFPHSRHNPQFNIEILSIALPQSGIHYIWNERLGGFRNGGYLKYMETESFTAGFYELKKLISEKRVCIMCAEILWFKCHRRFISDKLVENYRVIHIYDEKKAVEHFKKTNTIKCE